MTVRVTRKVRRVVERLDKAPATAVQVSADTAVSLSGTYIILDRLFDARWLTLDHSTGDYLYALSEHGRACLADFPPAHGPRIFNIRSSRTRSTRSGSDGNGARGRT